MVLFQMRKIRNFLTDDDRLHKEMLVAQKVWALIKCALCRKPRCIYSYIQTQNLLVTLKLMLNSLLVMENMHVVAVLQMRAIYVIPSSVNMQVTAWNDVLFIQNWFSHCLLSVWRCIRGTTGGRWRDKGIEAQVYGGAVCSSCKRSGLKPMTRALKFDDPKNKKKK